MIRPDDQSAGKQFLKTAGVMLANMALYTAANIGIGKASSVAARIGVSAIKKFAEKDGAGKIVKMANKALGEIVKAKEVPTIFDVGRSLGLAIPKIAKTDKAALTLVQWGKEQAISTMTGMIAQNIDAISDGRNLSMKDLFIEASVADLGFKGAGYLFKSSSKAIGTAVTKWGNDAWNNPFFGGRSLKDTLTGIDATMSFIHKESQEFIRDRSLKHHGNAIAKFDAKFGITAASNNIAATIHAVSKASETSEINKLRSLFDNSRKSLNSTAATNAVSATNFLDKRGLTGSRYRLGPSGVVEDTGYADFTSGMSTIASTVSKILSFESVPIVNTVFANKFISQNTETTVYGGGEYIYIGSKGTIESNADDILTRFIYGNKQAVQDKNVMRALRNANSNNPNVQHGVIKIPERYSVINSADGMFLSYNSKDKTNITRIGHLSAYTGNDADAGKYVNFNAVSSDSRLAEVVSSSIDKTRKVNVGADDETGLLAGIKFKQNETPYGVTVTNIQGSGVFNDTDIIDNENMARFFGTVYSRNMRRQDQVIMHSLFHQNNPEFRAFNSVEDMVASGGRVSKQTLHEIEYLSEAKKPLEMNIGTVGIDEAKRSVVARDLIIGQLEDGKTISLDLTTPGSEATVQGVERQLKMFLLGEKLVDERAAGDFVKKMGTPGSKITFGDLLPENGNIQIKTSDGILDLRTGVTRSVTGEVIESIPVRDSITFNKSDFDLYRDKRSLKDIMDEMNLENITNEFDKTHNKTAYMMATSVTDTVSESTSSKFIIGLAESPHDLSNVVTPNDAVAYSAMASVNALARKWGMDVDLTLKDDLASFLFKVGEEGAHTALNIGIGVTAIDAILKTSMFEGTRLEDGIVPFLASSYQDVQMFGNTVLNTTGVNHGLKAINDAVPGLINSPLGGGILSIAPIVMGVSAGLKSGSSGDLLKYSIGGGIASAVLGGLGSSIVGAYDPTMEMGEAYAIATGQQDVEIRKGRFWGLSSGSFWGSQIQYHRGSALFNSQLNLNQNAGDNFSQLSDYIGTTNAYERNIYSRPYANISGGSNAALGIPNYSDSVSFGGGNGLPTAKNVKDAANVYGLRGFIAGDVVLGAMNKNLTNTDMPTIADPEDAYDIAQTFNNANLGGMFGQTEYLRRVLPKRNNANTINPIRNLLPDWMPGSNYMINFKEGDAFAKIMDGEQRLPGVSNLIAKDRKINLVADLSFMGMLNDEDTINMAVYGNLKNNRDNVLQTTIKNEHLKNIRQISSLNGFRLKENTTYTTNGNVTATADYDFNGESVKVEVVDDEKFESISKHENNVYKNKADLLATIAQKKAKYIIINQDSGEKIEIGGTENQELLRTEVQKIFKLAPEIKKKIQETGMGAQNLYSLIDRFVILADVAPYSSEFKQYKQMMTTKANKGELSDDELIRVAEAIKKQEAVTQGIYTSTGKPSVLANLLPSKLMNPDDLDPLTVYREENIYSSGMKTWNNPTSYFRDDAALTASGKINPVKRAIGSGILYRTLYGNAIGGAAAATTLAGSAFASLTGGIEMRGTYDESRDILLKKAALEYKMNLENGRGQYNENNLYAALKYGTGESEELAKQLHRDDRIFYNSVKGETDPERQQEILASVSPQLAVILEKEWGLGGEYSTQYDTGELDSFIDSIDEDSILLEQGVNPDYLVMREMQLKGIDPRSVGLGFGNQINEMNLSQYGNLEFSDSGKPGELSNIRSVLGVSEAVIEGYNVSGDRTITVEVVVG